MIKYHKLAAIAVFSLTLTVSANAGTIKSSFTATDTGSWTESPSSGSPTTNQYTPRTSNVEVTITQKKEKITQVVVVERRTFSGGDSVSTSVFTPSGPSFTQNNTYSEIYNGQPYTDTYTASGTATIKVTLPKERKGKAKPRKSSGGKISIALTQTPIPGSSTRPNSTTTWSDQESTNIQVTLSKRPTLTYSLISNHSEARNFTGGGTNNYSSNTVQSGQGKATGNLTP